MLKTYELCPKKYFFRYIKSISMPVNDEVFETGKNIHAIASYYLRKENIDKMEASLSDSEKILWNKLKATKYFTYQTINTEYNLSVKIDDKFLGGRLDALVKNLDRFYILDYKTGAAPKNAKYDYQTMIYLLSVSEYYKTDNVSFIYLDLKNNSEVQIDLTSDLAVEYRERLSKIIDSISNEDVFKRNENCNCEYMPICF